MLRKQFKYDSMKSNKILNNVSSKQYQCYYFLAMLLLSNVKECQAILLQLLLHKNTIVDVKALLEWTKEEE